jgi:hypothetical protein
MHQWLVRFLKHWMEDDEHEAIIEAPRLWDVSVVLQRLYPGAVIKGVAWIMPELEEE